MQFLKQRILIIEVHLQFIEVKICKNVLEDIGLQFFLMFYVLQVNF